MNKKEQYETEVAEMALDKETPFYNEQRAEAIYKIFKKISAKRVLDVGCGLGKVPVYLHKRGMDVCGIDVSQKLIKLAKEKAMKNNINVYFECTRLEKFKPKKKFDAVLFAGVLEHIGHEERLMAEARRILKEKGKIVVFDMPTFDFLYTERDRRIGHTKRYTKKVLRKKLELAGYSDIKLMYYNFFCLLPTLYLKITKKKEYPYMVLNPVLKKLIYWWYKYVENSFVFPIGDRLIAIGTSNNSLK